MRMHRYLASLFLFSWLFFGSAILLSGKSSGPDTKLTGAIGESTCLQCHASHKLNRGPVLGGSLEIKGMPEKYEAGKAYILTIQISHPGSHAGDLSSQQDRQTTDPGESTDPYRFKHPGEGGQR